jgi:hypothetical protein
MPKLTLAAVAAVLLASTLRRDIILSGCLGRFPQLAHPCGHDPRSVKPPTVRPVDCQQL